MNNIELNVVWKINLILIQLWSNNGKNQITSEANPLLCSRLVKIKSMVMQILCICPYKVVFIFVMALSRHVEMY